MTQNQNFEPLLFHRHFRYKTASKYSFIKLFKLLTESSIQQLLIQHFSGGGPKLFFANFSQLCQGSDDISVKG